MFVLSKHTSLMYGQEQEWEVLWVSASFAKCLGKMADLLEVKGFGIEFTFGDGANMQYVIDNDIDDLSLEYFIDHVPSLDV